MILMRPTVSALWRNTHRGAGVVWEHVGPASRNHEIIPHALHLDNAVEAAFPPTKGGWLCRDSSMVEQRSCKSQVASSSLALGSVVGVDTTTKTTGTTASNDRCMSVGSVRRLPYPNNPTLFGAVG